MQLKEQSIYDRKKRSENTVWTRFRKMRQTFLQYRHSVWPISIKHQLTREDKDEDGSKTSQQLYHNVDIGSEHCHQHGGRPQTHCYHLQTNTAKLSHYAMYKYQTIKLQHKDFRSTNKTPLLKHNHHILQTQVTLCINIRQ